MTRSEYKNQSSDLSAIIDEASKRLREIEAEFLATAPFKYGDKVVITKRSGEQLTVFVRQVNPGYEDFIYEFAACKVDGTMSMSGKYVGMYDKIELFKA